MLKISGEALSGSKECGFDLAFIEKICNQIKTALNDNIKLCILIGGGNFIRGRDISIIDKYKADQIGMLSTLMNAIFFKEMLKNIGVESELYSAFECSGIAKIFDKNEAVKEIENGKVILFAGGTGHPFFTTDTGVVLRALEMNCDEVLLAKSIDYVYDKDPKKDSSAKKYDEITYDEIISKNLKVVDLSSIILSKDNNLKLRIFALQEENSIIKAIKGEKIGTIIKGE